MVHAIARAGHTHIHTHIHTYQNRTLDPTVFLTQHSKMANRAETQKASGFEFHPSPATHWCLKTVKILSIILVFLVEIQIEAVCQINSTALQCTIALLYLPFQNDELQKYQARSMKNTLSLCASLPDHKQDCARTFCVHAE